MSAGAGAFEHERLAGMVTFILQGTLSFVLICLVAKNRIGCAGDRLYCARESRPPMTPDLNSADSMQWNISCVQKLAEFHGQTLV